VSLVYLSQVVILIWLLSFEVNSSCFLSHLRQGGRWVPRAGPSRGRSAGARGLHQYRVLGAGPTACVQSLRKGGRANTGVRQLTQQIHETYCTLQNIKLFIYIKYNTQQLYTCTHPHSTLPQI